MLEFSGVRDCVPFCWPPSVQLLGVNQRKGVGQSPRRCSGPRPQGYRPSGRSISPPVHGEVATRGDLFSTSTREVDDYKGEGDPIPKGSVRGSFSIAVKQLY